MTDDTLATVTEDTPPAPKPKTKRQTKRTGPAPAVHRQVKTEGEPLVAPTRHTVRPGDTLEIIAKEYGTTVEAIIKANRFDPTKPRMIIGRDIYLRQP